VGSAEISDSGLETTYGYGASIIRGLVLSDHTVAFARARVIRSHFAKTKTGGQVGVGIQTALTQNVDLRGEYDFAAYGTFKRQGFKNEPRTDAFNLSAVYNFD